MEQKVGVVQGKFLGGKIIGLINQILKANVHLDMVEIIPIGEYGPNTGHPRQGQRE
jgi:hypothetical protein